LAPELRVPPAPPSASSGKLERDPYGLPNSLTSDNFLVSWGNSGGVTSGEINNLVDALESAWSLYIDEMEHPQPSGSETWFFNVFIGDSGNGAPDGYGSGGYYSVDPDGHPMIVVSAGTLNDGAYTLITGSHEFYHAIQGSLLTYSYDGESAWFWEATATWGSAQVYPDNIYYSTFLFAYVFYPHYPVNFFDYPDSGQLQEYYQYGSYLWPYYLSEYAADWSLIRDAWTEAGGEDDPLEALRQGMEERGLDLDQAWLDHLAINQVWDYANGDLLKQWVDSYAQHYSEGENMIAAEHNSLGTQGWEDGPADLRPRRYGSNAIRMDGPVSGQLNVYIEGEEDGDENSNALYGARLVIVESDDSYTVLDIPFEGVLGELSTDAATDAEEIWLVVGAWTEHLVNSRWEDEKFAYRYALLVDETFEKEPDTADPDTGGDSGLSEEDKEPDLAIWVAGEDPTLAACGCAQGRRTTGWLALGLAMLGWMRRRYR
jgi:hypothetical protein